VNAVSTTPSLPAGLPPAVSRALQVSAEGDPEGAIRMLRAAAEEDPASGLVQFLLAAELAEAGAVGDAEAAYANAVLLAPQFHIARFQLGLLQFTSGRAAIALLTWQPLLALGEDEALPHFVRAFAALAGDHFAQALEAFAAGIARNSENEPLNADMRKVVAGIEDLLRTQAGGPVAGPAGEQPAAAAEEDADAGEGAHVLLSNYHSQSSH
jgi:tetratricopeptide (TPR) repeat protein